MLILSVPLTVLSLALLPLFLWLTVKVGRARREVSSSTQKTLADLTAITEETLSVSGILLSKSFGRQRYEIGRFRDENAASDGPADPPDDDRPVVLRGRRHVLLDHAGAGVPVSRLGARPRDPSVNAGDIVAFTTLQSRLFFPIGSMLQVSTEVQSSLALFDRIFEYLDLRNEIEDAPDAVTLRPRRRAGRGRAARRAVPLRRPR